MAKNGFSALGPDDIFELLLEKLNRRGILLVQTPRFVKDVMNAIAENRSLSEEAINDRLVRLGWGEQILDGYIMELIRFLSENPGDLPPGVTASLLPQPARDLAARGAEYGA